MFKAFKYRLYPTAPQAEKINQNIGCARFVYNHLLDDRIKVWKETKQLSTKTYSLLKDEHGFLKSADSRALKHAQANLDEAYEKFKKNQTRATQNLSQSTNVVGAIPLTTTGMMSDLMVIASNFQKLVTSKLLNTDNMKDASYLQR